MKMLELFCGTKQISNAFKRSGWETYTVDWNPKFNPDLQADISKMSVADVLNLCGGKPDVIWASPDCTTYSLAACYVHRYMIAGSYLPRTDYARFCDNANVNLAGLLKYFSDLGTIVFIENPRGIMRKMGFFPYHRYTVTYCQYGDFRQKPTDIWTNHPNAYFKPCCKKGDPCHEPAPRGADTGSQSLNREDSAKIPTQLCEHIVNLCNDHFGYYKETGGNDVRI